MLALRSVTLSYDEQRTGDTTPVVDDLTHEFAPEAVTVVTGPSGSGKSTILYLSALMLTPTRGTVHLGTATSEFNDARRAQSRAATIGFVFQDALLDPTLTVRQNVAAAGMYAGMRKSVALARTDRLLERLDIADRAGGLPGHISGGQAQRASLCRALLKQPPVILADEPTGNLDKDNGDLVWATLAAAARAGSTVVVATHDVRVRNRADHVLTLRHH